jgi:AbrB family looped-hinge helix DNA binding protein
MVEEPEVATVGTKGQIVIPQQFRKELKIGPKTKLALYMRGNKIVVTKLDIPPLTERLDKLLEDVDKKYRGRELPTEREILEEIQSYRREKRSKTQGA